MIKTESIQNLLSSVDVVTIVEKYVPLKKSGVNFLGICPFHDDRHPSMSVNSAKGIFHCFSCGMGGNAIKFIQEYEKISYPQAIEKLADMVGFSLEYDENGKKEFTDPKILESLNAYYQSLLYSQRDAVKYLYDRGLDDRIIQDFGLGFAPASDNTIRFLENENIPKDEALKCGAIKENERGLYASFFDRITFPIFNDWGKIVGFGGRTISNHPAKYVNSPQSYVFNKSKIFYAFDKAKKTAYDKKELIITEGYMDVIMLHKAGFNNAVAVLGTALTNEHIPLLKRGEFRVILCFDGDSAGINAAIKSARLLSANKIDSSVVIISGGADPADMVVEGRIDELKELFKSGMEGGEFVIRTIVKKYDISRPALKISALNEVAEFTNSLEPIIAMSYENLVARLIDIPLGSFSLTKSKVQKIEPKKTPVFAKQKDINELQILKSMLNNRQMFEAEFCVGEDFMAHREIYEIVTRGAVNEEENSIIRGLEMDTEIVEFTDFAMFHKACKIIKERYLTHKINELKNSDLKDKNERIFTLQKALNRLKTK